MSKHVTFAELAEAVSEYERTDAAYRAEGPTPAALRAVTDAQSMCAELLRLFVHQASERNTDAGLLRGLAERRKLQ